jgi:hypothetical protein
MANGASSDVYSPDRHADALKPIAFPLYSGNQQRILPINVNRIVRRIKDANRSGAFFRPNRINCPWRRRVAARGPPPLPILPRKMRDVRRRRRGLRAVGEQR